MYEGMFDLLEDLKTKGVSLSINTSASDANTFDLLKRLGIDTFFDHVVTRDFARSKVDKFREIAKRYETDLSDFLFITDSLGDVKESAELNIPTIIVSWGVHDRSYFENLSYEHVMGIVDTVEELRDLIG
jgi:phosphoglycolate phosphatase-like HAD superfamily hydrolase